MTVPDNTCEVRNYEHDTDAPTPPIPVATDPPRDTPREVAACERAIRRQAATILTLCERIRKARRIAEEMLAEEGTPPDRQRRAALLETLTERIDCADEKQILGG